MQCSEESKILAQVIAVVVKIQVNFWNHPILYGMANFEYIFESSYWEIVI